MHHGKKMGLDPIAYTLKPAKKQDFEYARKLNEFKEPQNIIEEIKGMFGKFGLLFEHRKEKL